METNAEEGDSNTAAFFYRPLMLLLVLVTTTKTAREGKINYHYNSAQRPAQRNGQGINAKKEKEEDLSHL